MKQLVSIPLNFCLGLFLADGAISTLDATLNLCLDLHLLAAVRAIVAFLSLAATFLIYVLMAITPMVPKRFFLPIALFYPAAWLASIPVMIYHFDWFPKMDWAISLAQLVLGAGILFWMQGGAKIRWPFLPGETLGDRRFGWLNLLGFLAANVFVLGPGIVFYLGVCASLAVGHFSDGFLALRADGLTVTAKTYVRKDGKTIQLIPMMHIGEASFYDQVSKSFPTNAIVLLEGVTDDKKLIKQELSYKRAANSLGLTEQQEEFAPMQGELRRADIDVSEFSPGTLELVNLATRLHAQGISVPLLLELIQKSQSPVVAQRFKEDLLDKRNEHLLQEIETALQDSEQVVVPWGAAHMPGIARGIQTNGFVLDQSREYSVMKFHPTGKRHRSVKK